MPCAMVPPLKPSWGKLCLVLSRFTYGVLPTRRPITASLYRDCLPAQCVPYTLTPPVCAGMTPVRPVTQWTSVRRLTAFLSPSPIPAGQRTWKTSVASRNHPPSLARVSTQGVLFLSIYGPAMIHRNALSLVTRPADSALTCMARHENALKLRAMISNILLLCRQCGPEDHRFSFGDLEIVSPSVSDAPWVMAGQICVRVDWKPLYRKSACREEWALQVETPYTCRSLFEVYCILQGWPQGCSRRNQGESTCAPPWPDSLEPWSHPMHPCHAVPSSPSLHPPQPGSCCFVWSSVLARAVAS